MLSKAELDVLKEATLVMEDLLHITTQLAEAYGHGISNETHERTMAVLGDLDIIRAKYGTHMDWHHAAARYIDEE